MAWRNGSLIIISIILIIIVNFVEAGSGSTPRSNKAIVIDPFNREFSDLGSYYMPLFNVYNITIQSIIYNLERAGYSVDYYKNEDVTLDLLKRIDNEGYGVIYINTHGFLDSNKVVIFTREKKELGKEEIYKDDIESGRIGCFELDESLKGYYYITPEFFYFYGTDGQYSDALVFIDACFSGNNSSLADVFLKLGAKCFIGWSCLVGVEHGVKMDGLFFHIICTRGLTVTQSLAFTVPDPVSGARLVYFGDGDLRLNELKIDENLNVDIIFYAAAIIVLGVGVAYKILRLFQARNVP
ncbi:MAG: hypothetical protein RMJ07_07165 [Nitrososphaerota archaeon]|nr:hypothetical protein [Candidatus Bathyarchaeota archaeon]MDW8049431.1 hypothetical protein [Nitrososphaerota archaeon]